MSRIAGFNSPLFLGFDHLESMLDRVSKSSSEGYPPYNIEQTGDYQLRITLAVAGFSMENLQVTVEDTQLVVRGRNQEDETDRVFIHRGIAARQFLRSFVLADGIEISGASLDNGLLHVDLVQHIPEPEIRNIPITKAGGTPKDTAAKPKAVTNATTIDVDPAQ